MATSDTTKRIVIRPRRVAVFRALALGDMLCAVPTLRALRQAWPTAEITLIGLPWAGEFVARLAAYIDRFVEFPGWPGLPERQPQLDHIPDFLSAMQSEHFDLAIQLHGAGTIVNSLVALWGARQTAGFFPPGYCCPDPATFMPWPEQGLELQRLLSLVDFLGLAQAGDALEIPLTSADFERLKAVLAPEGIETGRYAVIHAGASVEARRWPAQRFAVVADALAEAGFDVVLTGVESERPIVRQLAATMHRPWHDLCGRTDLGTLGALVSRAALVVCNDTGISHVAAATQTPSIVISTGNNPARWAPIERRLHRVLASDDGVSTEDVCRVAHELLRQYSRSRGLQHELVTA